MLRRRLRGPLAAVAALSAVGLVVLAPAWASEPEWNVARVGGPRTAPGAVIAIVDTGVDAAHPAFAGRVIEQVDYVGDGRAGDPVGHGTHVAGTAAGADAGCGSIGIAPDARLRSYRVIGADGAGDTEDLFAAIRDAADDGATVINLSLGVEFTFRSTSTGSLRDALAYAWSKGAVPVIAAGNDAFLGGLFGSGYSDMKAMVVTATDNQDQSPSYATSVGSADWGIAAPGGDGSGKAGSDVKSAWPDLRCAYAAGTSQAAPHVSGAIAVLRIHGYTQQGSVDRLLATARDLGSEATFGAGLLDLNAALGQPPVTTVPTTRPTTGPTSTLPAQPNDTAPTTSAAAPPSTDPDGPTTTAASAGGDASTTSGEATTSTSRRLSDSEDRDDGPSDSSSGAAGPVVVTDEDDSGSPVAVLVGAAGATLGVLAALATRLRRR